MSAATLAAVPDTPARAGIYCRISRDMEDTSLGVKRQERLCREITDRLGWSVVDVYEDNDVSATGRKPRPDYLRLLADIAAEAIDVVVALDSDRLLRKPRELLDLIDLCEAHHVRVRYQSGGFDPATGDGLFEANIRATVDAEEVRKLKKRVSRKALELAEAGKVGGGGTRPFGYEADRVTIRESEAVLIRDAVDAVLAGASLRSVARQWNEMGVRTPAGNEWPQTVVRRVLTSPRIAGLRQHRGEIIGKAVWPEIVDEAEWRQLFEKLRDPDRLKRTQPARRYLLRGFLFTADGEKMISRPRGDGARSYFGHGVRCLADPLENEVVEQVLHTIDTAALGTLRATERQAAGVTDRGNLLTQELAKVERLIEEAHDARFVQGTLPDRTYQSVLKKQEDRRAELEQRLAELPTRKLPRGFPDSGEALRKWWGTASLDDKRLLLSAVIERVTLHKATAGLNRFDPSRVEVTWKV